MFYRVGVVLHPGDKPRYLKWRYRGVWSTTTFRYACRLFARGAACGHKDRINSQLYGSGRYGYAFIEEA